MADEETPPKAPPSSEVRPKPRRKATSKASASETNAPVKPAPKEEIRAPKRASLTPDRRRLLTLRRTLDGKRPIFGRQAANRYWRIGRDGSWRRPRGLQSKQRRHYGYRTQIVSIGYRSPAAVRGLVPSGFRPVIVHTPDELEGIDARTEAAIIARTVGTRRRLTLEETARKLGIHVLNPIVKSEREA